MELLDVSDADDGAARRYIDALLYRDAAAWDWSRRGVYYFRIVKMSGERHCLAMSLQHAAFDGYSVKAMHTMLRDTVLDISSGTGHTIGPDEYRTAVEATLLTASAERVARRYWARELDRLPEAFGNRAENPVGKIFVCRTVIAGDDYRRIRDSAAGGGWDAATVFLRRLLEVWQEREPGPCLIDTYFGCRPRGFDEQLGMFANVRPLVFELDDDAWRDQVSAKLMRASAYQCVDSIALRGLEEARGIRDRPFLAFDYQNDAEADGVDGRSALESSGLSQPPRASMRPVSVHVSDTGVSFVINVSSNSRSFSRADADRLLYRLAAG